MHYGIDILEAAFPSEDPKDLFDATHRALASACKVIARADDSSGIIGDACRRLLELHPKAALNAKVAPARLIKWMMKFQFEGDVDYFELDIVAYAPALGEAGVERYRQALEDRAATLGPRPTKSNRWSSPHSHHWFVIEWNEKRLAVLDRDIDRIIETHLGDATVAAWFEDVAKALDEIAQYDLAIEWAKKAADFGPGHQSEHAARYWCELLAQHHPDQAAAAALEVVERWPNSRNATRLHALAGTNWPQYAEHVLALLKPQPREAVSFVHHSLGNLQQA
jgi:tetratricopeptide (TPR) repeat protein